VDEKNCLTLRWRRFAPRAQLAEETGDLEAARASGMPLRWRDANPSISISQSTVHGYAAPTYEKTDQRIKARRHSIAVGAFNFVTATGSKATFWTAGVPVRAPGMQ